MLGRLKSRRKVARRSAREGVSAGEEAQENSCRGERNLLVLVSKKVRVEDWEMRVESLSPYRQRIIATGKRHGA